jgi:hypothetical protein
MGKPKPNPDRALVPVVVANRLGVRVSVLAGWMRAVGADGDGPLREADVIKWRADPSSAPEWFRTNMQSFYADRELRRQARAERDARLAAEYRDAVSAAYEVVCELLRTRDRKLWQGRWLERHPAHEQAFLEIVVRAMKDSGLAFDGEPDFTYLGIEEREALRVCGYDVPEPALL